MPAWVLHCLSTHCPANRYLHIYRMRSFKVGSCLCRACRDEQFSFFRPCCRSQLGCEGCELQRAFFPSPLSHSICSAWGSGLQQACRSWTNPQIITITFQGISLLKAPEVCSTRERSRVFCLPPSFHNQC